VIPAEAVEAAAKAWVSHSLKPGSMTVEDGMREILEAAAPYMYARALDDAVQAFPLETIVAPDNAVVWMMRRAEELHTNPYRSQA
jgi:hypothetical protein